MKQILDSSAREVEDIMKEYNHEQDMKINDDIIERIVGKDGIKMIRKEFPQDTFRFIEQSITYLKEQFDAKEIYTGVSLGNEAAKGLYKSMGFTETGLIEEGMEELRFICG